MNTTNKTFNQTDNVFSERAIAAFRSDTEGCNHVIHLNNAGTSLMPNVVTQSILDHIKLESQIGGYEASALRADAIRQCYVQPLDENIVQRTPAPIHADRHATRSIPEIASVAKPVFVMNCL
ncbi:MAG: hypothetical protein ACYDCM_05665 [Candidatus Acidiferrales bacterium]